MQISTLDRGTELDTLGKSVNTKLQADFECRSKHKTSSSLPTNLKPTEKCGLRALPAHDEAWSSSSKFI